MKTAKGVVGKVGTVIGVTQVVNEAQSGPTRQETLESFTFQVAKQGKLGNIDSVNEGVFRFNNDDLTIDQATNVLNATFTGVSNTLSNFDLTTDQGINDANEFLKNKDNFNQLINDINNILQSN